LLRSTRMYSWNDVVAVAFAFRGLSPSDARNRWNERGL
jgi:hypothetical protein